MRRSRRSGAWVRASRWSRATEFGWGPIGCGCRGMRIRAPASSNARRPCARSAPRSALEAERDRMRLEAGAARAAATSAQQTARELAVQVESRRSSHASLTTTLSRIEAQLETLETRRNELANQLAEGEAPLAAEHGR